jgi:hypothetical protein
MDGWKISVLEYFFDEKMRTLRRIKFIQYAREKICIRVSIPKQRLWRVPSSPF